MPIPSNKQLFIIINNNQISDSRCCLFVHSLLFSYNFCPFLFHRPSSFSNEALSGLLDLVVVFLVHSVWRSIISWIFNVNDGSRTEYNWYGERDTYRMMNGNEQQQNQRQNIYTYRNSSKVQYKSLNTIACIFKYYTPFYFNKTVSSSSVVVTSFILFIHFQPFTYVWLLLHIFVRCSVEFWF